MIESHPFRHLRRARSLRGLCLSLALLFCAVHSPFSDSSEPTTVVIVATGGTIAGVQNDPDNPGRYRAGTLSAEDLVSAVPQLERHARIETRQFSNIPSTQMNPALWVRLSSDINQLLRERDDVAGVVVTHGTDRMEETAFFLHLTVQSDKPVVMVGSQRPATGISADGPANLLAAVRVAASAKSRGLGTVVVMDEQIVSAREVRKRYQRVGGFGDPSMGLLGAVGSQAVEIAYRPQRRHSSNSEFRVDRDTVLPVVDVRMTYAGSEPAQYQTPPAGLVLAGTGTTCHEVIGYLELARSGVAVVGAFPGGLNLGGTEPDASEVPDRLREGCEGIESDRWNGTWLPTLGTQYLTPLKTRVLLMLALHHYGHDREQLRRILSEY